MNKIKLKEITRNSVLLILSFMISLSFIEIILSTVKLYQIDVKRFENKKIL